MINWEIRIKNKLFWVAFIPAVLLVIKAVLAVFGIDVDFTILSGKLIAVIEAVFSLLAILGIVVDPTTAGVSDSEQALTYTTLKKS